jgi:hypothetical protein
MPAGRFGSVYAHFKNVFPERLAEAFIAGSCLRHEGTSLDRTGFSGHVRFTPDSDRIADIPYRELRANIGRSA